MEFTPRLGLGKLNEDGSDPVAAYRETINNHADTLDSTYAQGTLAKRPESTVAKPGVAGRIYYATDTKVYSVDSGTAWNDLPVTGAWTPLTELSPELEEKAGYNTLQVRKEGNIARLRGALVVKAGKTLTYSAVIAKLPVGFAPPVDTTLVIASTNVPAAFLGVVGVKASGVLGWATESVPAGHSLWLDETTWSLT